MTGKGPGEQGRGAQPDPTGGLLQTLECRAQVGRGPLEVGPMPSLVCPLGTSLEETRPGRCEMGPGSRGRNALKSVRSRQALGTCAVQCMAVIS